MNIVGYKYILCDRFA